jgi:parvulin-like peptidyl-prolyl isomerase
MEYTAELLKMRILKYIPINLIGVILFLLPHGSDAQYSQGQMIDKIIAKVDNYIVLRSDLDKSYLEYVSRGQEGGEEVRCGILESLVVNKLLLAKAEIDSVEILDEEVQMNLDQRMQIIISQIGSEQRLEEYYGKTVDDFKTELFKDIREQMLADKMQRTITNDVKITPSEVKKFFNSIPNDSLPFLSTEVSIGQIVKIPEVGKNQKEKAREKILEIRNRILNGTDRTSDKENQSYTGTWSFDINSRLLNIELNEISFSANEFQSSWKLTRYGTDSIRFDNNDLNNSSHFYAVKEEEIKRSSPVISMDFLMGTWKIVKFNGKGEDFAALAREFSDDPGSARAGGDLGFASRGTMVPEFEAVAMRLKPGEISMPVETDFGYHLIQLIERRGNEFHARHILIRPNFSEVDFEEAENFLDSLRSLILNDSLIFENLAKEYSDDDETAGNGGFLLDATGSTRVSVEDLDPVVFFTIDTMEVGNISHPVRYRMRDGKEAVRILYYKDKMSPHQANLKEDYQKIQLAALNEKKQNVLTDWFDEAKKEVFIQIDDEYKKCRILEQ